MSQNPPLLHVDYIRSKELGDEITELYGFITAATHDLLVKIRAFDEQKLWELDGICSCAHWLNWKCGIGMNAGREKVRVANALDALPKISAAFRNGEISFSKVRAITRVATPNNEDLMLEIAKNGTAHHVESVVSGYRRAKVLNEDEVAEEQFRTRAFDYRLEDDGSLVFNGRLPAEVGAMLVKAIECAVDNAEPDTDVTAVTWEPISTRRADALSELAESYLETGPASSSSADRYQVMVHVTAETLESDHCGVTAVTSDEQISHIENGPHVTAVTSRRICCDSSVSKIIEDETGEPLSIGRKSRVIPPPMRRALKARDRICRFPGCTHQYFIDGHHIKHWADGGETNLDNLVQLCRRHHRLVHEGGFACEKDAAGNIFFKNQHGDVVGNSGTLSGAISASAVAYLKERLEERHIHSETCVSMWDGEPLDRDHAVSMMWHLDHPL